MRVSDHRHWQSIRFASAVGNANAAHAARTKFLGKLAAVQSKPLVRRIAITCGLITARASSGDCRRFRLQSIRASPECSVQFRDSRSTLARPRLRWQPGVAKLQISRRSLHPALLPDRSTQRRPTGPDPSAGHRHMVTLGVRAQQTGGSGAAIAAAQSSGTSCRRWGFAAGCSPPPLGARPCWHASASCWRWLGRQRESYSCSGNPARATQVPDGPHIAPRKLYFSVVPAGHRYRRNAKMSTVGERKTRSDTTACISVRIAASPAATVSQARAALSSNLCPLRAQIRGAALVPAW